MSSQQAVEWTQGGVRNAAPPRRERCRRAPVGWAAPLVHVLSRLLLACLGPYVVAADAPPPIEGHPPAGFVLDGRLGEWTGTPALVLGQRPMETGAAANGAEPRARVWWAFDGDGLLLAARMRPDAAGRAPDPAAAGRMAVWIALPPPVLPAVGFAHQFGEVRVARENDCLTGSMQPFSHGCREWFRAQQAHRAALSRVFMRRYVIGEGAAVETWAGRCTAAAEPAIGEIAPCPTIRAVAVREGDGHAIEARIPLDAFPATGQLPLRSLGLMVEVPDAAGYLQEDGAASAPQAGPGTDGNRLRWHALRVPLEIESEPAMVGQLLAREPVPGFFYAPAARLDSAWVFANLAEGYQYAPSRPSPEAVPLAWGALPALGTVGEVSAYLAPALSDFCAECAPGSAIVAMVGGKVRAVYPIGEATVWSAHRRMPGLQVVVASTESVSWLGTGACGNCPVHVVRVLGVAPDGSVTELLVDSLMEEEILEGPDDNVFGYRVVDIEVAEDGTWVAFAGEVEPRGEGEGAVFRRTHRWDEPSGRWSLAASTAIGAAAAGAEGAIAEESPRMAAPAFGRARDVRREEIDMDPPAPGD